MTAVAMSGRRLVMLPGMGADATMYSGLWQSLPQTRFVDWPPFAGERTLPEVARRVINFYGVTAADDIGGTSLGGMIALEIATLLGLKRVLLVSSALSPREVNPCLRMLSPLTPIAPLKLAQEIIVRSSRPSGTMLRRAHTGFLRAMCIGIVRWGGYSGPTAGLVRIHGGSDWMIRCPPEAHRIPRAGHLAVLTHSQQCVDLVRRHWFGLRDP